MHLSLMEPTVGVQTEANQLRLHKYWMKLFIRICVMRWRICLHNKPIMDVLMCILPNFSYVCYLMKRSSKVEFEEAARLASIQRC